MYIKKFSLFFLNIIVSFLFWLYMLSNRCHSCTRFKSYLHYYYIVGVKVKTKTTLKKKKYEDTEAWIKTALKNKMMILKPGSSALN